MWQEQESELTAEEGAGGDASMSSSAGATMRRRAARIDAGDGQGWSEAAVSSTAVGRVSSKACEARGGDKTMNTARSKALLSTTRAWARARGRRGRGERRAAAASARPARGQVHVVKIFAIDLEKTLFSRSMSGREI